MLVLLQSKPIKNTLLQPTKKINSTQNTELHCNYFIVVIGNFFIQCNLWIRWTN